MPISSQSFDSVIGSSDQSNHGSCYMVNVTGQPKTRRPHAFIVARSTGKSVNTRGKSSPGRAARAFAGLFA